MLNEYIVILIIIYNLNYIVLLIKFINKMSKTNSSISDYIYLI